MAKKIRTVLTLQLPAGKATPAPPVGTALGPHGINIIEFTKSYNERTAAQSGSIIPAKITIFEDRSFTFIHDRDKGIADIATHRTDLVDLSQQWRLIFRHICGRTSIYMERYIRSDIESKKIREHRERYKVTFRIAVIPVG